GAEVLVAGGPGDDQGACVLGCTGPDRQQLGLWSSGIDLDPPVGDRARGGRRVANAVAVRHDQAPAIESFARQVELGGTLAIGVVTQVLPGLALVPGHPDLDLADAAGTDLVDAVIKDYVGIVNKLPVGVQRVPRGGPLFPAAGVNDYLLAWHGSRRRRRSRRLHRWNEIRSHGRAGPLQVTVHVYRERRGLRWGSRNDGWRCWLGLGSQPRRTIDLAGCRVLGAVAGRHAQHPAPARLLREPEHFRIVRQRLEGVPALVIGLVVKVDRSRVQ